MNGPLVITLAIVGAAVALFLSDRIRPDLVAMLVVVALGIGGVLTPREAFSGFANSAIVTIFAIFILAQGLQNSGVAEQAGRILLRVAGTDERRLVIVVMVAGALLSLFMNNIAAAAVLMPAVSGAAKRANVSPSRLLMPLAFATILGGMATLFTTTNIVVSGILRGQDLLGFGVTDFAPVGVPLAVAGVAYMALWGRRLLPAAPSAGSLEGVKQQRQDLAEIYRLGERLFRARIPAGSCLIGRRLAESTLREEYGVNVIHIERNGRRLLGLRADTLLQEGDVLLLEGRLEEFVACEGAAGLELVPAGDVRDGDLRWRGVVLAEALLAPRSALLGQTLRSTRFRQKFGMNVLGIWRGGRPIRTRFADLPLEFGDALLLQGPSVHLKLLHTEPDIIVLGNGDDHETDVIVPEKGRLALLIMGLALLLAAFNTSLVGEIMLAGALVLVLTGVLSMDQAYQAVEWRSIFLVGGILPLGLAMTKSGAAALLANQLVRVLGPSGPLALLAGLFVFTALLTQTMHGAAVASVVAPIAIQTAQQTGMDPRALAMGVALATSMAFLTPLGHPVNILVMGPGGYRFRDFLRVGLPLSLLLFAVVMLCLPIFWPLAAR